MKRDQSSAEFNRALLTLEGLIYGISADDIINQKELDKLKSWKKKNYNLIKHHPIGDLIHMLDSAVGCQILQDHEKTFITDFCRQYGKCEEENDPFYCDLLRMEGYIQGILADRKIYTGEIRSFHKWLKERPHLSAYGSYNELIKKTELFLKDKKASGENLFEYLSGLFPAE